MDPCAWWWGPKVGNPWMRNDKEVVDTELCMSEPCLWISCHPLVPDRHKPPLTLGCSSSGREALCATGPYCRFFPFWVLKIWRACPGWNGPPFASPPWRVTSVFLGTWFLDFLSQKKKKTFRFTETEVPRAPYSVRDEEASWPLSQTHFSQRDVSFPDFFHPLSWLHNLSRRLWLKQDTWLVNGEFSFAHLNDWFYRTCLDILHFIALRERKKTFAWSYKIIKVMGMLHLILWHTYSKIQNKVCFPLQNLNAIFDMRWGNSKI